MAVPGHLDHGSSTTLRAHILGPLRLWRGTTELDPGPRRQAGLLAVLLALEGQSVSRSQLVDLMWPDEPPASALNIIQKYIGALRRLLEPGLPTRAAGSYLHRRGDGYLLVAGPGTLDLVDFRQLVDAARAAVDHRPEVALDRYAEALALWQGPSGEGLAVGPAATPIFVGLDAEFFGAGVEAAHLALQLGRPQRMVPALHLAASMAPLREPVQAALVLSLGAADRQAEALAVYRTVRARLAEELGIDPGPELQAAQRRVLTQNVSAASADVPGELFTRTADTFVRPDTGLVGRSAGRRC